MNEYRFLYVLDMIVLNLLDEGRRTYSLYRMCICINYFIGFTDLFIQSNNRGLFEAGYFSTNIERIEPCIMELNKPQIIIHLTLLCQVFPIHIGSVFDKYISLNSIQLHLLFHIFRPRSHN